MENDRVIIILLAVIVVMLIIGILLFGPFSKEECRIEIVSMDSLNVGDQFAVFLSDNQGNPVANAAVSITFSGSNGAASTKQVTTDASGNAAVGLDDLPAGGYSVTCSVTDDKYKENSISKQISINEVQTTTTTASSSSNGLSDDGYSYYPESGPARDSMGTTREQAIASNMHYIPQRIDGMDAGVYVPYDSKAGCYHT